MAIRVATISVAAIAAAAVFHTIDTEVIVAVAAIIAATAAAVAAGSPSTPASTIAATTASTATSTSITLHARPLQHQWEAVLAMFAVTRRPSMSYPSKALAAASASRCSRNVMKPKPFSAPCAAIDRQEHISHFAVLAEQAAEMRWIRGVGQIAHENLLTEIRIATIVVVSHPAAWGGRLPVAWEKAIAIAVATADTMSTIITVVVAAAAAATVIAAVASAVSALVAVVAVAVARSRLATATAPAPAPVRL